MTQRAAGNRGKGRKKGVLNKTTALLKGAILKAAESAGDAKGLVGYLEHQARKNPGPFLALLGRVLPIQVTGSADGPSQGELSSAGPIRFPAAAAPETGSRTSLRSRLAQPRPSAPSSEQARPQFACRRRRRRPPARR